VHFTQQGKSKQTRPLSDSDTLESTFFSHALMRADTVDVPSISVYEERLDKRCTRLGFFTDQSTGC